MYKFTTPNTKSSSFPSEGPAIPKNPYVPSSCEDHLKKEASSKSLPSQCDALMDIGATRPVNLEIVPNSGAEVTRKEQVQSIFYLYFAASPFPLQGKNQRKLKK